MEGEQDRSEQPTAHKLARARDKGTVARGGDLSFFTGLCALLALAWFNGEAMVRSLSQSMHDILVLMPSLADGDRALLAMGSVFLAATTRPLLLAAIAIAAVILLFELVQTGFVFSATPLVPDFGRLNPGRGLKRIFSARQLVETLKNILKLCLYGAVGYLVLHGALAESIAVVADGRGLPAFLAGMALRLGAAFAGLALVFAILDQIIVRRDFLQRMRMSRQELRREVREREGEPRLRQKRKQIHAELARTSRSLRNLRGADVMIVNPQHIAIALRYDAKVMTAPAVVAVGVDHLAQRLRRLALYYGIPVIENRKLAQALYRSARLEQPVPESFYQPIADIYNAIRRRQKPEQTDV